VFSIHCVSRKSKTSYNLEWREYQLMEEILVRIVSNLQASCQVRSRWYAHKKALFPGQPPRVHHRLLSCHCDNLIDNWSLQYFRYKSWSYSLNFVFAWFTTWKRGAAILCHYHSVSNCSVHKNVALCSSNVPDNRHRAFDFKAEIDGPLIRENYNEL
jgi:hypothetical protein